MSTEEYRVCEACGDATPADDWTEEENERGDEMYLLCPSCGMPEM